MTPTIQPLTAEDHAEVIAPHFAESVRGYTAKLDGKIIGVMGVVHSPIPLAIGRMWPELRKHPRTVIQAIAKFREMLHKNYTYVSAVADADELNSPAVLERVGFVRISRPSDTDKGVFVWRS